MSNVVVVDDKDEVIGTMEREESHRTGTPHRIVVVYVENDKGQILIQVRMTGRLDHSSAGHVDPGESYEDAACRELEEELGIRGVALLSVGKATSEEILLEDDQHRVHVMQIYRCVAAPGELQPDEVKDVYWAEPEEVQREMLDNPQDKKFSGGFRASLPIYLNR